MVAMTATLTEFSINGNSRTYTTTGHSVEKPKLVLQKRRVPSGSQVVAEDVVTVLYGTEDADGTPLAQKISMEVKVRRPTKAIAADISAALVLFRDIVANDEFSNTIDTQEKLK